MTTGSKSCNVKTCHGLGLTRTSSPVTLAAAFSIQPLPLHQSSATRGCQAKMALSSMCCLSKFSPSCQQTSISSSISLAAACSHTCVTNHLLQEAWEYSVLHTELLCAVRDISSLALQGSIF